MWRDGLVALLLFALFAAALYCVPWREPGSQLTEQREEFLTQRIAYLEDQVRMERQRADASEKTAQACGRLLGTLKDAMGVGP
jgi:Rad3-related DNA helicase